jgi:nitrate reductase gamma subunit
MSNALRILENVVQVACLIFMVVVYALRIAWLLRFRMPRERTFAEGSESAGAIGSLTSIIRPGAMESSRSRPWFYIQFVVFHLGIAAAIAATFIIPYGPGFFRAKPIVLGFQAVLAAAFFVGLLRLVRRLRTPAVRLISSPDDYFSIGLMIFYFGSGCVAIPASQTGAEGPLFLFFGLTSIFLVYVPFSKISHYLYYPFARYALGKALGHRGVLLKKNDGCAVEIHETRA